MRSLAIVVALAGTAAANPTASQVLGRMQGYYAQQTELTAELEQTVVNPTFGTTKTSNGKLWALKPSSFRIDYYQRGSTTKVQQSFISNGTTLWWVNNPNQQVTQTSIQGSAAPAAISFLTGGASLATMFDVALDASGNLELTPKQPSAQYAKVMFVVGANGEVAESKVFAPNGETEDYKFTNARTTAKVNPAWFTKPTPANYKLVVVAAAPTPPAAPPPPAAKP